MQIGKQKIADRGIYKKKTYVKDKSYNSAKIPHNRKVPIPFSLSLLYAKNILFYRKSGCAGACRQAVAAHSIKGKDREKT